MSTFSMEQADNYGSSGSGSFFVLKNDGEKARVRFLYKDMTEVEGHAVHQVEIGDKKRYVNCLRAYNEPIDKCPLCEAKYKVIPRLFVKLYNEDAGECQIWERGKKFFPTLSDLCSHHNPLYNEVIEITRHGKPGDQQTTYTTYPISNSEVNIEDYDCSDPLGTIILDKDADEMRKFIYTGNFEAGASNTGSSNTGSNNSNQGVQRRVPANDLPF